MANGIDDSEIHYVDSRSITKEMLKDEIDTMEEYSKYLEIKNKKLKKELNSISKYVDEDERITNASRKYAREHDFSSNTKIDEEEIDDNTEEVLFKMEMLQLQLCNLTKKFLKMYPSQPTVTHDSKTLAV